MVYRQIDRGPATRLIETLRLIGAGLASAFSGSEIEPDLFVPDWEKENDTSGELTPEQGARIFSGMGAK